MKNAFVQAEKFPYNNLRFWVSIRVYFQVLFENDVNENYYYTLSELAKLIYYSIHLLFFCFVKWTCQIMPIFQSVFAPFLKTEISIDHLNRINVFYNAVFMTVKQVYQIRLIPADYIRTRYLEMILYVHHIVYVQKRRKRGGDRPQTFCRVGAKVVFAHTIFSQGIWTSRNSKGSCRCYRTICEMLTTVPMAQDKSSLK